MAKKYKYELADTLEQAFERYRQLVEGYHDVELTKMEFTDITFYSIRYR